MFKCTITCFIISKSSLKSSFMFFSLVDPFNKTYLILTVVYIGKRAFYDVIKLRQKFHDPNAPSSAQVSSLEQRERLSDAVVSLIMWAYKRTVCKEKRAVNGCEEMENREEGKMSE